MAGLLRRVDERPTDLVERIRLADTYREMGAFGLSNAHYREAKADERVEDRIQTTIALNLLDLGDFAKARKQLESCVKNFPRSQFRPLHLSGLVESYVELDRKKNARERLVLMESEFPGHPATVEARELIVRQ